MMRCRQSSPPMECAKKLTPRATAFFLSCSSKASARDETDPVLRTLLNSVCREQRGCIRGHRGDNDFGANFVAEDAENFRPVVHAHARKRSGSTGIKAI